MRINKHDTQGTKPLLGKGELGYDDYTAGGDVGRVYVGTGSENIALAEKSEIDSHVNRVDNPHNVTKTQVGLGNVDNTADSVKNVLSATKWTTARTITLSGDVAGSVSMDGTANVSITTTVQPNSVALGTDTTGNYVAGIAQGTGITVSGTAGEGWNPTVAITDVGTAGTYTKVTTNAQGQVTSGTTLAATDIPELDASKITTGIIDAARLPAYVDDVLEFADQASFPATGESGKIYVALDTNKAYRWSGSVYVYITSGAVDSVNGQTGVVNITTITGNAGTATALQTARTVRTNLDSTASVSFNGSANITPGVTGTLPVGNGGTGATTLTGIVKGNGTGAMTAATAGTDYVIPSGSISGNAGTATKLQTSRNIALAGAIVGSVNFDGSADVSISTTLGAQSFIQSSGLSSSWGSTNGTGTGAINAIMGTSSSATWLLSGTSGGVFRSGIQSLDSNGTLRLYSNSNYVEINGNQITGNISTATKLATARTINGVSFDGSANITVSDSTAVKLTGNQTIDGVKTFSSTIVGSINGNSATATAVTATDNRSIKPVNTSGRRIAYYFTSNGGLTSTADTVYGDLIALNSYNDTTGGLVNGLFLHKNSKRILHYQADMNATTWGTPHEIAYTTDNVASATKLATARTINGVSFDGSANITIPSIPTGGIIMWSGSIVTIPAGWLLCDGANGTPDLRDRFVVGAGSTYGVGATGGSKDAVVVEHTHTGSTASAGAHTHTVNGTTAWGAIGSYESGPARTTVTTSSSGAHTHSLTINSTGSSGVDKNLPPYYALAYIMKT